MIALEVLVLMFVELVAHEVLKLGNSIVFGVLFPMVVELGNFKNISFHTF